MEEKVIRYASPDSKGAPYRSLREREAREGTASPSLGVATPGGMAPPQLPADGLSRRRFLTLLSASAALAAGGASCSRADRGKVVPYTKRPEEVLPGNATYYASTFPEGVSAWGVLVKTREGRPIHVEGNDEVPGPDGSSGEATAPMRAVADVLGLYDPDRLRGSQVDGQAAEWGDAVGRVAEALKSAAASGKRILLVTGAALSPSRRALIADLRRAVPGLEHVAWEPTAGDGEIIGARRAFGEWLLPTLRFDLAEAVVALEADSLGSDPRAARAIAGFAARRRVKGPNDPLNRLWAVEGSMTLTGSNADERVPASPATIAALTFALAKVLAEDHGLSLPAGVEAETLAGFDLDEVAKDLGADPNRLRDLAADLGRAGKAALVVAGPSLPPEAHVGAHLLSCMLGAEGSTIEVTKAPPPVELAATAELHAVLQAAAGGSFGAAIFWGANPAHSTEGAAWKAAVAGIPFRARIGLHADETAGDCQVVLAESHWLESWGDHEPASDLLCLQQPAVAALHDTRQGEDAILDILRSLGEAPAPDYVTYLKARWEREVYPLASGGLEAAVSGEPSKVASKPVSFDAFWSVALHDGVLRRSAPSRPARTIRPEAVKEAAAAAGSRVARSDFQLVLAPGTAIYDGRYGNNGWLQELPDPVTKVTWGNPLAMSLADADALGVVDGDVVRVEVESASLETPVIVQPGQARRTISMALGYGRSRGAVAAGIGTNAFALVDGEGTSPLLRVGVKVSRAEGREAISRTQEHHSMEGRDLARSWTRAEYGERAHGEGAGHGAGHHELYTLYPELEFTGPKWGMAIDLSACVGCSACVVACQSENNVSVVGPEEVARSREMHWIRIDRYYEGDPAHPRTVHQPVLCQHCDHAPCESVCPVNATTHSPDGLNQMTYNRCVGTRYCANNCPYKVRRFNFFDHTATKREPEALAFNPEVSVRPRGVMEKCTFCVQRIQDVRQRAKVEGRPVRDGEIRPACAVVCPAQAIVFGDLKDPASKASGLAKSDRGYKLLEEFGARPAITYLARVTNPFDDTAGKEEGSR